MSSSNSAKNASAVPSPATDEKDEKSQSFRKRRLSLSNHTKQSAELEDDDEDVDIEAPTTATSATSSRLEEVNDVSQDISHSQTDEDDDDSSPDPSEKAQSFRKRRLSLPNLLALANAAAAANDTDNMEPPAKRSRRDSAASAATSTSGRSSGEHEQQQWFPSKTLHASELLHDGVPPPSPAVHANSILYELQPLPPMPSAAAQFSTATAALNSCSSKKSSSISIEPKWKRRLTIKSKHEEHKLPFPRDIVGTYSCHGVEPVYDTDYEAADDDEEWDEDDDEGADDESPLKTSSKTTTKLTVDTNDSIPCAAVAAKINQDRGGIAFPYGNCPRMALFAVYDGHGQGGELVSQYTLAEMQRRLERHETFPSDLHKAFVDTFHAIDEGLKSEPLIEPVYAGTTACVALLKENVLTLANAGDSRAVVARKRVDGKAGSSKSSLFKATALTVDQNPDLPEEMQRILSAGGYVTPAPAPGLSARVWLDPGCTQIGLAMARSIGDHAVSEVGVIATPVVTTYTVHADDEFLILASDGVWEFLSSQNAVDIVGANLDRGATKACQALIEAAAAKWHEEEGEYRDDITAIVVRLPNLWNGSDKMGKA
ncbi:hypothetical protein MPSEU_000936700 [Mayamaea pseudoterrestris]|nr:hypothetical protein MPSEU_000936700 [Mayamaea pseudoterrestris]